MDRLDNGASDIAVVAAAAERSSSTMNSFKSAGEDIMSVLLAHERPSDRPNTTLSISAAAASAAAALGIKTEIDTDVKDIKVEPGELYEC